MYVPESTLLSILIEPVAVFKVAFDPSGLLVKAKTFVPVPPVTATELFASARPLVVIIVPIFETVIESFTTICTLTVANEPNESVAVTDSL